MAVTALQTSLFAGLAHAATVPAAPVNVRVVTGGSSIAVLWNPASGTTPKSYTVYRNNSAVATVAATAAGAYVNTARYLDAAAKVGASYTYQVKMTDTANQVSALSAGVRAVRPAASATTPVPSVTVSTTAGDLTNALNSAKADIQAWYPKFADAMARPAYAVPSSIRIVTAKNTGYAAYALGTTITVDEGWLRAHLSDPAPNLTGLFLHEMTHILQQYPAGPGWVAEGLAVWATHTIFNDGNTPAPSAGANYTDGYDTSSYFIEWVTSKYNLPSLPRDLNIAAHAGTYSDAFFTTRTGKTAAQLWNEMTGVVVEQVKFTGFSGLCIDVKYADNTDGSQLQIGGCWDTTAQAFTYRGVNGLGTYTILGKCLDARSGGTADGTAVQLYACNGTTAQQWSYRADGTLFNPNAGKCIQPTGGSGLENTVLELFTCNGSAAQVWTKQAL